MANQGAMFDEFVQGGLLDDADVTIKSARFVTWDYRGKAVPVLALNVKLEDGDGAEHDEYLSSGDLKAFVPSNDGKEALAVGSQTKLNSNTNAVAFILSVINADTKGELAAKIRATSDISVLDGTKVHVIRKNQPKRSGIPVVVQEGGNQRVPQRLEVEKILSYAWEAGSSNGSSAKASTANAPAATGGVDDELEGQTLGALMSILGANGGSMKKAMLAGKVFGDEFVKGLPAPIRNKILGRIVKDEFLKGELASGSGISFDGTTVSIG